MVPLPSVCFASTTRKVPGSCTVHVNATPASALDALRAGDVAEREVGIGDVHGALDRPASGGARQVGRARRHDAAEHTTERAGARHEREQEDYEGTPRHAAGGYRHPGVLQSRGPRGLDRGGRVTAGSEDAPRTPGTEVVPRATPVPAPAPGVTDVLRRSARLGLGAVGLAGRAAGGVFADVPDPAGADPDPDPGLASLLPGAVLGMAIEAEKRAAAVVDRVVDTVGTHSGGLVRAVMQPAIVQRAMRPVEDVLWHWNEVARREQARNRAEASAVVPVIVQQVAENVIGQLDFERIVRQIPVADIVAQVDVEAVVARVDLAGVIRESTASVGAEAVDALREQGMALDAFGARVVDRILFRKQPRRIDLHRVVMTEASERAAVLQGHACRARVAHRRGRDRHRRRVRHLLGRARRHRVGRVRAVRGSLRGSQAGGGGRGAPPCWRCCCWCSRSRGRGRGARSATASSASGWSPSGGRHLAWLPGVRRVRCVLVVLVIPAMLWILVSRKNAGSTISSVARP